MDDLDPSPVLARADALMQRRRQNAANEFDDVPLLTEVVAPDDDIPVVTDVVANDTAATAGADALRRLADELAVHLRAKLAAEIPTLVEAALASAIAGLTEDLRQGVRETADQALQDFLAAHGRATRPPPR